MEYKETQNSILFKNEYEEEFLKLTKEFGVDAVSKAYSNDEFSIYFFSCIEDQDKINSLMNSLKKKTKCDIIIVPAVAIIIGGLVGTFVSPYISNFMILIGDMINRITEF